MAFEINAIRHPKEKLYGVSTLIAGGILWAIGAALVLLYEDPLLLAVGIAAFALVIWQVARGAKALARAYMFGHFVLVGPDQFPHIYALVEDGARRLGLREVPTTFVYNSGGMMNAFALRLIGKRRYIWLTSAIIDADSDEQLRFVIGHELGHHVAGHLDAFLNLLRWPCLVMPFDAAYSRSRELTCDRVGAFLTRDFAASRSALQMLACGSAKLNASMNGAAFAAQEQMVPPLAGFVLNVFSDYPRLTHRVNEVVRWLESQGPDGRTAAEELVTMETPVAVG